MWTSTVLVDRYILGKELEVDAICDGRDVFIPGIMEHVEHTGIHSGDSISVYPTFSVSQRAKEKIIDYTVRLGLRIGIVGLYNIQFIVAGDDDVYVIEVNPRSSRTVPFLSKSTGVPMAPHRHAGSSWASRSANWVTARSMAARRSAGT